VKAEVDNATSRTSKMNLGCKTCERFVTEHVATMSESRHCYCENYPSTIYREETLCDQNDLSRKDCWVQPAPEPVFKSTVRQEWENVEAWERDTNSEIVFGEESFDDTVMAGKRLEVGDPVVLKHGKGFRWVPYDYMISKEGYIFDDNRKFDYNCRWKSNSPGKIEMED
jgi:hypothetical protein